MALMIHFLLFYCNHPHFYVVFEPYKCCILVFRGVLFTGWLLIRDKVELCRKRLSKRIRGSGFLHSSDI